MQRLWKIALGLFTAFVLVACGGGGNATTAPTAASSGSNAATAIAPASDGKAKLAKAVYAKSLAENQSPVDETTTFQPDQTIYLSLAFEGRPKQGVVETTFLFDDNELASTKVDFADANSGVLFSFGETTFAGFNLTHEKPLPISKKYRADVKLDGKPLGSYPFAVVAPKGAIPSKIDDVVLARGATDNHDPIDPTNEFAPSDTVYLVGSGSLGNMSWVQVDWYVDGKIDKEGTRSMTAPENLEKRGFHFFYLPKDGWSKGEHEVVLTLNDEEVKRLKFTIGEGAAAPTTSAVEFTTYSSPDGVFTIDVPTTWQAKEKSAAGKISNAWFNSDEAAGVFVQIAEAAGENSADELIKLAKDFVQSTFGSDPKFQMGEAVVQTDGSQRIAWSSSPEMGGKPTAMTGLTFVEQRGNKLSLITVVVPTEKAKEMAPTIDRVLNSYKLNPDAKIK